MNSKPCWVIMEQWNTDFSHETRWDVIGIYDNEEAAQQERQLLSSLNNENYYSKYYIKRSTYYETSQPD